jgi:hypothetical protein
MAHSSSREQHPELSSAQHLSPCLTVTGMSLREADPLPKAVQLS